MADDLTVRRAEELASVMRVLDGALLDVEAGRVRRLMDGDGTVLVAEVRGRVVGALVLADDRVEAVAVARRHRRLGVGRRLVEAAADRRGRLIATFRPEIRGFYEAVEFDIEEREGRLWGHRE